MKIPVLFAFTAALAAAPSAASQITLSADARGWYYRDGTSNGSQAGNNYVSQNNETRNWMSFDLTGLSGSVTAATIVADSPSNGWSGVLTLYDVSTNSSTLGQPGLSTYQDLGSGTVYGAVSYTPYNLYLGANLPPITVSIPLNSDAVSTINADLGGHFSVGGSTSGIYGGYIFGFTSANSATSLVLQFADDVPVPEPATIALLGLGVLGIGARRRRRSIPII